MKTLFFYDKNIPKDEAHVILNPKNLALESKFNSIFLNQTEILLINPTNQRKVKTSLYLVESIYSFSHLCKVQLITGEIYYWQKRLKELDSLEDEGFYRINNTTILNISLIDNFRAHSNARLEVSTRSGNHYLISRHYAQFIKEKFL